MQDQVAGGTHWRLSTGGGPVHVWRPANFVPETAGVVIYLHGYFTNVDEAWALHALPEQFRDSGRNALFICPEAPVGNTDTVKWQDPSQLFDRVRSLAKVSIPEGPVVAMGHSGAFRTIVPWLTSPVLDEVILLDGLYNNTGDFQAWVQNPGVKEHRMVLVGFETSERTEQMVASIDGALVRDQIPALPSEFTRRERQAQVLFLRSQYGHMEIITEGKVIPALLGLSQLQPL